LINFEGNPEKKQQFDHNIVMKYNLYHFKHPLQGYYSQSWERKKNLIWDMMKSMNLQNEQLKESGTTWKMSKRERK
jgi:hypothetical protein